MADLNPQAYIGDVGATILIETNLNLSTATVIKLNVYAPNKELKVWTAIVDTVNNKYIKYIVQEGDFSLPGYYYIQPYVEMGGGYKGKGETMKILIKQAFA